jgi:uncharacterized protein
MSPSIAAIAEPDAAAAPVDTSRRLQALDILRGLALFGMILVHFHQKMRIEVTGAEDLIGWAVYVLVEEKAWGTFAFLFGAGFAVLLRRLDERHESVVPIYLRRLAALASFGVIAEVGFGFTVLFTYACWGLALLVVRRWSTRALLITAIVAAAARPVIAELLALWAWYTATPLTPPTNFALRAAVETAAAQGSYLNLLAARWALFVSAADAGWRVLVPDMNLTLFILGLLAVRYGVIDKPREHTRLIRRWMIFGAISWFVSWVVLPRLPSTNIRGADWPLAAGLGIINEQWLCFTYIGAVLLLLAKRPRGFQWLAPVGQAGRMALTNYMLQIAVLDLLASGYGFGLKLRPLVYAPAAIVFFAIEAALSTMWLARFHFGPLEWLWRTFTYLRPQPLRRN